MKAMKTFAALLALAFSLAGCGAVDGDPVRPAPGSAGQGSSTAASGADSAEPEQLVTNILVTPSLSIISLSHERSSCLTFASIAAKGSSSRRRFGFGASALAKATRCFDRPKAGLDNAFQVLQDR